MRRGKVISVVALIAGLAVYLNNSSYLASPRPIGRRSLHIVASIRPTIVRTSRQTLARPIVSMFRRILFSRTRSLQCKLHSIWERTWWSSMSTLR